MWNLKHSNSPCYNKERLLIHKEHLERLIQVKEKIDNAHPIDPIFLKIKANKVQNERDNIHKLKYENTILYNRMYSILQKPSYYNFNTYKPFYCPAFDKARFDWSKKQSTIDLEKRNTQLYNWLNNTKSFYPNETIKQQTDFYQYLKKNMDHKETNPNINYVPYTVFYKKIIKKICQQRSQSAIQRPRSSIKRPQSSYSVLNNRQMSINANALKFYSNRSMISNKSTSNITYNPKEIRLIK